MKVLDVFKSKDGYLFFHIDDGRVVDNLNEEHIDMEWSSYDEFVCSFNPTDFID